MAVIIQHMAGNMLIRWTDLLTTDGEKEWRNRDAEFESTTRGKEQLTELWENGWNCCSGVLNQLPEADLLKTIFIRKEGLQVMNAINRQLACYPYHVGQIIYLARIIKNKHWQNLSFAKGNSELFNSQLKANS